MDSYRMNCRNVSGNCRNRTCGNMTGNRESMIPMDSTSKTCTNICDCMQENIRTGTFAEASAGNGICANAEIRKGI